MRRRRYFFMGIVGILTFLLSVVYHAYPSRSLLSPNIRMAAELELEPTNRTENAQIHSEFGSSSELHAEEYYERSRLVLNVRTRQWAEGRPKGSSCRPAIDRCDLDSICSEELRCVSLNAHVQEEEEGEQLPARKYDRRAHEIMKMVEKWTLNLHDGDSCSVEGKRCDLGLNCINGMCQNSKHNESRRRDVEDEGNGNLIVRMEKIGVKIFSRIFPALN